MELDEKCCWSWFRSIGSGFIHVCELFGLQTGNSPPLPRDQDLCIWEERWFFEKHDFISCLIFIQMRCCDFDHLIGVWSTMQTWPQFGTFSDFSSLVQGSSKSMNNYFNREIIAGLNFGKLLFTEWVSFRLGYKLGTLIRYPIIGLNV